MTSMTLRMPDDMGDRLRHAAEAEGVSANQAVVTAIADWLAVRADRRADAVFADIARERADLLARLADA